jgi:site-specific recombinase XerD
MSNLSDFSPQELAPVNWSQKPAIYDQFYGEEAARELTISTVAPVFLEWTRYEMRRAPWTVQRYREALGWVVRDIGDQPVAGLHLGHLLALRRKMEERGCKEARMAAILHTLRSLLKFCRNVLRVQALDPRSVRVPAIPRRDVVFLSKEEVAQFLDAIIGPGKIWETAPMPRLAFRALAEVLLGTGARISEVLSLDRASIHFDRREAKIIGKGNKERILFFTERSIEWLTRYLSRRRDDESPLFVKQSDPPGRLTYAAVKNAFQRLGQKAGLDKKVTAHILRHTMATTLLFNGCPIGHIKVALGHDRLDTTCRYYLGLDLRAAKEAHHEFLRYD